MRIPGIRYVQGRNSYSDPDHLHYGIAIHNTSNDASASNEASYATRRTDGTSSHFYVDDNDVVQSLDTDAKAGHAGSAHGNNHAIAIEITGTNAKSRAWWLANVAWAELGKTIAHLIKHDPDYAGFQVRRATVAQMKSNPKVRAFYSHDDMRRAWGGTTHTDPGSNFPWDRLFTAVNDALKAAGGTTPVVPAEQPANVPAFPGRVLTYTAGKTMMRGNDVKQWQTQMRKRGWTITADGVYGPASKSVATAFQREKRLTVDGKVGPQTWRAAWTATITK